MDAELRIFDGHNDVVSKLLENERDGKDRVREFFERGSQGHIDLPRAKEGGLAGGLFSIYVAADPYAAPSAGAVLGEHAGAPVKFPRALELGFAQRTSLAQLGILFRLQRDSQDQLRIVRTLHDVETACNKENWRRSSTSKEQRRSIRAWMR